MVTRVVSVPTGAQPGRTVTVDGRGHLVLQVLTRSGGPPEARVTHAPPCPRCDAPLKWRAGGWGCSKCRDTPPAAYLAALAANYMTAPQRQRWFARSAVETADGRDGRDGRGAGAALTTAYRLAAAAHATCAERLEARGLVDDADPEAAAVFTHYGAGRVPLCGRPGRIEVPATCPACRRTLAAGARHTDGPPRDLADLAGLP